MKQILSRFLFLLLALFVLQNVSFAEGNGRIGVIEGVKTIGLNEAENLLGQPNVIFIDVTSQKDRKLNGYIPKSLTLANKSLEEALPKDKNVTLVFYGLNRFMFEASRSAEAAIELGYKNSVVMLDGIEAWATSGRAIEKEDIVKWESAKNIVEFTDTIHGRLTFGKTPSCRDCHAQEKQGISIVTAGAAEFINQKCSQCHQKAEKKLRTSVHGVDYLDRDASLFPKKQEFYIGACGEMMMVKDQKEKPNCNTCHSVHITPQFSGIYSLKQQSEQKCAECHKEQMKTFAHSFHGKGMALSAPGETPSVATCYDCHGKHNILKSSDRDSTLSLINRVDTCKSCHPNANQNFADFIAHSDYTKKEGHAGLYYIYIFMTSLVIGVFVFFGFHTLLWSIRLVVMRLRHPREWKQAQELMHSDKVKVRRFSTFHRIQHFFMALSFLGLAFSGLPQKFYDSSWAKPMVDLMGGSIVNATTIHHISAVVMFAVFFSHIGEILILNWRRRDVVRNPQTGRLEFKKILKALFGPDSLMPNMQDLRDMKAHFKWFFGMGPRPQFDRWTYWEKFDYLAVFWGMFVIGISGLILWFPTFFSSFLPGWALNAATLIHSDEAFLAIGFIFAIHFFNTHFRADRFPMDTVIFSGNLTEEELKLERNQWYQRLKESGKLEKLYDKSSKFASYKWLAKTIGFVMLFLGITFLFLMIYALYCYL